MPSINSDYQASLNLAATTVNYSPSRAPLSPPFARLALRGPLMLAAQMVTP